MTPASAERDAERPFSVDTAWKTLATLSLTRVLVAGIVLVPALVFGAPVLGHFSGSGAQDATVILAAYLGLAFAGAAAAISLRERFLLQLGAQLTVDLIVATVLVVLGGGMHSQFVLFYLVPTIGAALMLPTAAAFFICAIAVVALLGDGFLRILSEEASDPLLFQAGLFGAALFGITALLRLLTVRLTRQERLARTRGQDLRSQLEINRLVISQMEQGVVVIDSATSVHANNLSARLLLGLDREARLTGQRLSDMPGIAPLAEEFRRWLVSGSRHTGWSDHVVSLKLPGAAGRTDDRILRARFARPPTRDSGEYVMFLEDLRDLDDRAQRLKLAAMGRLTASIAHEIRNPLAAISHAGQLLAEDATDPAQRRLAGIVRENTVRLNRLVDDVLRAARREVPLVDELDLDAFVAEWVVEFTRDRLLAADTVRLRLSGGVRVRFEVGHLRQILFNLVDNALRHGSGQAGTVEVRIEGPAGVPARASLWVLDDGAGVPDANRSAIFEPFFTTRSKGTGLGLYLAREFCIANGAELSYDLLPGSSDGPRFGFCVRFAAVPVVEDPQAEPLDTEPGPQMGQSAEILQRLLGIRGRV